MDCVIDTGERLIPIEIKAGSSVRLGSLKGLANFMDDYGVGQGYVIFRGGCRNGLPSGLSRCRGSYSERGRGKAVVDEMG